MAGNIDLGLKVHPYAFLSKKTLAAPLTPSQFKKNSFASARRGTHAQN
jgi:hypothetical protein